MTERRMFLLQMPGGWVSPFAGTPEEYLIEQRLLDARHAYTVAYAARKGWPLDIEQLTYEQVLESSWMPGWQHPRIDGN